MTDRADDSGETQQFLIEADGRMLQYIYAYDEEAVFEIVETLMFLPLDARLGILKIVKDYAAAISREEESRNSIGSKAS